MRKIVITIVGVLTFLSVFSQNFEKKSLKSLEELGYTISQSITDYPKSDLPKGTLNAFIGTMLQEEYIISLLFSIDDSTFLVASNLVLDDDDATYRCQNPYVSYEDDKIITECQWMRGLTFGEELEVKNYKLYHIKHIEYDLNEDVYEEAEVAEKNNDPVAYCNEFMGAQYYSDLKYRVKESLEWAYKDAMAFYRSKEYTKAAELMYSMETKCDMSTTGTVSELFPSEFKRIWGDVTLFYLRAGFYKECISLSKWLLEVYPEFTGVYLQYGDALFKTENHEQSKIVYKKYTELMNKEGSNSKIPSRVIERLK